MRKYALIALSAMLLFAGGLGVGRWFFPAPPVSLSAIGQGRLGATERIDLSDYNRTWLLIKSKHIRTDITDADLFYGSVRGLVDALDDPYSVFIDPRQADLARSDIQGSFSGIGAEIGEREGRLVIIAPIDGSPAARTGLHPGDVITSIDGKETHGMKVLDAVNLIRGQEGTKVKLGIYRDGWREPKEFEIVREKIVTHAVKWETKKVGKKTIMVVKISQFTADAAASFAKAIEEAKALKVDGMVVDLRNDPGGLLDQALKISCNWASKVPLVVVAPRDERPEPVGCNQPDPLKDMPTVVLVNRGSASASEIVAGALQDHGKARVIGEQTFGKGVGQSVEDYPDGAQLRLTTFQWLTPKGRTIHKTGITPDEVLKADPDDLRRGKDVQLDRALQYLTTGR